MNAGRSMNRSAAGSAAATPQRRGAGIISSRSAVASAATGDSGPPRRVRSFSLIEVIAVLAIIAILLAVLLPALLKQLDRLAAGKETTVLKALAQGLQQGVVVGKRVPTTTGNDWAQVIAANAGYQVSEVLTNACRLPRACLIDPNLQIGTVTAGTLPFTQTSNGVSALPANPRFMILSSLAGALPVSSGTNSTFDTIWNTPDGAVPAGWPSSWADRGADLRIQRITLTPSFKRLILNNSANSTNAKYSIDGSVPKVVPSNGFDAYFVENSLLSLYSNTSNIPDATQVLIRDTTFTYANSNWSGNILGWPGLGSGGGDNLDVIIKLFMSSPANPWPNPDAYPAQAFTAMTNYVAKYTVWATNGFPDDSTWQAVKNAGLNNSISTSVESVVKELHKIAP